MNRILGLFCLLAACGCGFVTADDTYSAAVVEMTTIVAGATVHERVAARVQNIVDQIKLPAHVDLDIIVFPEYAIMEAAAQPIPDPKDEIVLCDNATYTDNIFQPISCAAKAASTYVVINALTQHDCKAEQLANQDERPCATNNLNIYNTNIVFNRQGALISIYRKFNLYNEPVNKTLTPDVSVFDTDFGVKFGHLICFDIMFKEPAASLLNLGVRNFVYPALWFSEIPFLTAIQIQQNWAHAHNSNFLASGINNPTGGSTGSGIYSGVQGALAYYFSQVREDKTLIYNVSKEPGKSVLPSPNLGTTTPNIRLIRDQLNSYSIVKLNVADTTTQFTLCHETNFCCEFQYTMQDAGPTKGMEAYEYVAAVYNGTRTFGGIPVQEKVVSCAVFTCIDASNISTCGVISESPVSNRYTFTELAISGQFRHNGTVLIPNTLAISLLPFPADNFEYTASEPFDLGGDFMYTKNSIRLENFDNHLMTFGIWGRSSAASASVAFFTIVLLTVVNLIL